MTLNQMKKKLEKLHAVLAENGGRGVELAEDIDRLQADIDVKEGRDIRVQNQYPDADSILMDIGSFRIVVYRDEAGDTHVEINDQGEGSCHSMILGSDSETQYL